MRAPRVLFAAAALTIAACAPEKRSPETVSRTEQAIIGGSPSDDADDATVMLFVLDPSGPTRLGICTAALIAPKLVLTARHCVASADDVVACNSDGTPLLDSAIHGDRDPSNLFVFTGKDRPKLIGAKAPDLDPVHWKPAGRGAEILDDGSSTLCNHDLALIVLEKPIENVPIASLRLDGEVGAGEKLLTVGWGVSSGEVEPSQRQRRDGVTVQRIGPSDSIPVLTKSEFLFDESICLGDSGGPIFDEKTNAIVGVVSRGGNGVDPSQGGPSATCDDADNLGTKIAPFKDLILRGFDRVGSQPKLEPKSEASSCAMSRRPRRDGGIGAVVSACALLFALRARRRR
jgi:hypothetical protein